MLVITEGPWQYTYTIEDETRAFPNWEGATPLQWRERQP